MSAGGGGPVGIAVIGAGNISTQYLGNLTRFPDVRVLAVADIDEARAAQAAADGSASETGTSETGTSETGAGQAGTGETASGDSGTSDTAGGEG